jgi:hypothetical protein
MGEVMNDKWWLIKGVIVSIDYVKSIGPFKTVVREHLDYSKNLIERFDDIVRIVPRGTPFECIPEWAKFISFKKDSLFFSNGNSFFQIAYLEIPFPKCPEEWKSNTYPITKEIRDLIK